jgi:uncharacterized protein
MKPHINILTLGVSDLERSLSCYREGLGFSSPGIVGAEFPGSEREPAGAAAMFTMDDGFILALYPRTELAKDAGLPAAARAGTGFSIGHIVNSREEVDAVLAQARAAGARVTDEPHERAWGIYSGYFADPDGYLWEVIHVIGSQPASETA